MTVEQFRSLNEVEQIEILVENGVAIAKNQQQEYQTFLYYIQSFFVVVIFYTETDELMRIIPLKQRDQQKDFAERFPFYHSN
ncbi:MAG TPA: hypothetical protein VER36_00045 [Flavisolibacter sp.]|nr:hypothetical protein [Flavisolibacter sp.]